MSATPVRRSAPLSRRLRQELPVKLGNPHSISKKKCAAIEAIETPAVAGAKDLLQRKKKCAAIEAIETSGTR